MCIKKKESPKIRGQNALGRFEGVAPEGFLEPLVESRNGATGISDAPNERKVFSAQQVHQFSKLAPVNRGQFEGSHLQQVEKDGGRDVAPRRHV